jgi:hypothetical protein
MPFDTDQGAYRALRDITAERTRNLIAWVGSGLSVAAGLPSWAGFKGHLVAALRDKARTLEDRYRSTLEGAARAAAAEPNPWTSFQILRQNLGPATYRDSVRDALKGAATASVPATYRQLWRMGTQGILNLNLDRLATRGFLEQYSGKAPVEFSGKEVARLPYLLNTPRRFVANLHGTAEDSDTWILTSSDIRERLEDQAYRTILHTCLTSSTIVFVGITADDVAVGGLLDALQRVGVETPTHYWITHRRDVLTDRWAEGAGIRVVRYSAKGGDHSELSELFEDLLAFVPQEPPPPSEPVSLQQISSAGRPLPPPSELATWEANEIRMALNRHAAEILLPATEESYEKYELFCREYDEAIYRAWYTSIEPGRNQLLGYTLERVIARGAFGRVFRARDSTGRRVAVKVLLEEIRANPALLKSFRRGVRSMTILNRNKVEGMVAYTEQSEIPAFVAMEWIDGPNLTEAKLAHQLEEWPVLLRIAVQLADIVRCAHAVPERVLHRDLRPQNVMLKGFYSSPGSWSVAVLDFDLSWHRGALEQSVLHTTSAVGYLAPEQFQDIPGTSTRNAAVDSFGLGMTLYFLCAGRDPLPDQHRHRDWEVEVRAAATRIQHSQWRSLAERFARLVIASTRDRQSERWDFAEICGELKRLLQVAEAPDAVDSAELLAEEVAATAKAMVGYEWNGDRASAHLALPTGLSVTVTGDEAKQCLRLAVDWRSTGIEDRRRVGKTIDRACRRAVERLRAGGWKTQPHDLAVRSLHLEAEIGTDEVMHNIERTSSAVDHALQVISFE